MSTLALPVSRDGAFAVTSAEWDYNGSFHVQVIDLRDNVSELVPPDVIARDRRRVRDLARRVDPMDETRWVRVDSITVALHEGRAHIQYSVTVSRLDPMYR